MELKSEIQGILDKALLPLGVHTHWLERGDDEGSEYVVFRRVSSQNIQFAGDRVLMRRYYFDVRYFAEDEAYNEGHVNLIKDVMHRAGYRLPMGEIPIPGLPAGKQGVNMEFATERVV